MSRYANPVPAAAAPPVANRSSAAGGRSLDLGIADEPSGLARAAIVAGCVLLPLAILFAASLVPGWDMSHLLRDTTVVASEIENCCSPHVGALSTLGLLVMAAAAAFFAIGALQRFQERGLDRGARLLAIGAAFSALFCVDDAFLLHEHVFLHRGVPEIVTYGAYGVLMIAFLWVGRLHLRYLHPVLLGATLAGFGLSVGIDQLFEQRPSVMIVEEVFKFVAIFTWAGFALLASARLARTPIASGILDEEKPAR